MDKTVVFAFDKFRGTATAQELTEVGLRAAKSAGWNAVGLPLADGGEGSIDVLGGANKTLTVSGPLGAPVKAGWRLEGDVAFIEIASASGLSLVGGKDENDPVQADTTGTGQIIAKAIELGARTVYVLLGGSASTDGGLGALTALPGAARLKEIDLVVAADVTTRFTAAAEVFGPQKGASKAQVSLLTRRLERLVQMYTEKYGVDVAEIDGAGAAGGLAGGLVAAGGRIESGFEILAEHVQLDRYLESASLVITGEGFLDRGSFEGKVVGGVHRWATSFGVATAAVVGDCEVDSKVPTGLEVRSLTDRYGIERAKRETLTLVEDQIIELLATN